ncbi:hypothetical protein BACCAP_03488 [Pseudoflavonifractor capillosus ATCC 29799]|uniref:Uncharacterized protein n=1 Tax=Pseudoflavonifractor capillosus ATCC 29799 TaxID=411467 RepID=A6NZ37_9FIRM|nr:hypothetical protein BACCAP_03488 [Pseudoflavonifractor capillosus ATCC 29799]
MSSQLLHPIQRDASSESGLILTSFSRLRKSPHYDLRDF